MFEIYYLQSCFKTYLLRIMVISFSCSIVDVFKCGFEDFAINLFKVDSKCLFLFWNLYILSVDGHGEQLKVDYLDLLDMIRGDQNRRFDGVDGKSLFMGGKFANVNRFVERKDSSQKVRWQKVRILQMEYHHLQKERFRKLQ